MTRRRAHIRGEIRSLATLLANDESASESVDEAEAKAKESNREQERAPDIVTLAPTIDETTLRKLARQRREYLRRKRGHRPKPLADMVMWGPPRHAADDAWPREKSVEWAEDTLEWVERHFPDSPITDAALHLDEGSPHLHVALFPRYEDAAGEMGYGWKRAERAASARVLGEETLLIPRGKESVDGGKPAIA